MESSKALAADLKGQIEEKEKERGIDLKAKVSYDGGPLYTTAINVLTLEVYYRYENRHR